MTMCAPDTCAQLSGTSSLVSRFVFMNTPPCAEKHNYIPIPIPIADLLCADLPIADMPPMPGGLGQRTWAGLGESMSTTYAGTMPASIWAIVCAILLPMEKHRSLAGQCTADVKNVCVIHRKPRYKQRYCCVTHLLLHAQCDRRMICGHVRLVTCPRVPKHGSEAQRQDGFDRLSYCVSNSCYLHFGRKELLYGHIR